MKRYLKSGRRLSLSMTRYQPRNRQYVRTGRTRTTAVENERDEAELWRVVLAAVEKFENRADNA